MTMTDRVQLHGLRITTTTDLDRAHRVTLPRKVTRENVWHTLARRANVTPTEREMFVTYDPENDQVWHGTRYAIRCYLANSWEGRELVNLILELGPQYFVAPNEWGLWTSLIVDGYRTGPAPADRPGAVYLVHTGLKLDAIRNLVAQVESRPERAVDNLLTFTDDHGRKMLAADTLSGDRVIFDRAVFAGGAAGCYRADLRLAGAGKPCRIVGADRSTTVGLIMPVNHPAAVWQD